METFVAQISATIYIDAESVQDAESAINEQLSEVASDWSIDSLHA